MRPTLALAVVLSTLPLTAAEKPVPVVEEPMHRTVLENEWIRILDVQIPPGETCRYHVHVIPSIVVYLTRSTNRSESWPDKAIVTREVAPGQSRYAPYDTTPLSHRVTNTGSGPFRVFDIELLKKPGDGAALPGLNSPQVKTQWEEKLARSSSVQLEPGEKAEIPANRCPRLVVAIRGPVRITVADARPGEARTLQWGEFHFFPAGSRLEIDNPAKEKSEAILLEFKG